MKCGKKVVLSIANRNRQEFVKGLELLFSLGYTFSGGIVVPPEVYASEFNGRPFYLYTIFGHTHKRISFSNVSPKIGSKTLHIAFMNLNEFFASNWKFNVK